jgi:predicted PurR-regulated permease PerM
MMGRPPVTGTARVLTAGTVVSAAFFVVALGLAAAQFNEPATVAANAGVVALLLTPAAGLVATAVELRDLQPRAAALAVVVLVILALAAVVALVSR